MITKFLQYLGLKQKKPITEIEDLAKFIHSSASFVSQVVLITYIKARSGTQYPKLFENTDFLKSIDIARSQIYASSVADLIFYIIEEHFKDFIPIHKKNKNSKFLVEAIFPAPKKPQPPNYKNFCAMVTSPRSSSLPIPVRPRYILPKKPLTRMCTRVWPKSPFSLLPV